MNIDIKVLSIPVDSVQIIAGWIVGCLKDLEVSSLTRSNAVAQFDQVMRFSLSFPDGGLQISDEALLEFVNIEEDNLSAAAEYIESHGVFERNNLELPSLKPFPKNVEEFWREMAATRTPFALRGKSFYSDQREIKNLQKLANALRNRDLELINECLPSLKLTPKLWKDSKQLDLSRGRLILRESIQGALSDVQIGVAELKSSLVPFAAPSCVKSALYLALLDQITRGVAIGECENPRCKKIFERSQPRKRFCSPRCQALIKVHRFRDKPPKQRKNSN
jgi:hypothetical protein